MSARTASICWAEGGVGSSRSSRGRRTCTRSRAGFSLTPRSRAPARPPCSLANRLGLCSARVGRRRTGHIGRRDLVDAAGAEERQEAIELDAVPTAVASATSTREARQLAAASASVGTEGDSSRLRFAVRAWRELAGDRAPSRQSLPLGREGAGVAVGALAPPSRYLTR